MENDITYPPPILNIHGNIQPQVGADGLGHRTKDATVRTVHYLVAHQTRAEAPDLRVTLTETAGRSTRSGR